MDVLARVSDFLDHLERTSGPVLIFAHGGVLVAAQVYAGKVRLEDAMQALPPYGGMVEIDLPLPRLHPVMLAGTGSDVGKSVLAAALCRIFLKEMAAVRGFRKQVKNCPYEKDSHRSDMKEVLARLEAMNPEARYSLWGSMNNIQRDLLPMESEEDSLG